MEEPFWKQKGQVFWTTSSANAGQQVIFLRKDRVWFIDMTTETRQIMQIDARDLE